MIIAYTQQNGFTSKIIDPSQDANLAIVKDALWIDLVSPTKVEEEWIESIQSLQIPTIEEMREIELSSRLYVNDDSLFMTATMVAQSQTIDPKYDAVTFVLNPRQLITVRYIEPLSFKMFSNSLLKNHRMPLAPMDLFISLLEVTIDRLADVWELVGHDLDSCSKTIFQYDQKDNDERPDYQQIMQSIGIKSNLSTKARDSLVTFSRLITFFGHTADHLINKENYARLTTITKDLNSLSDYANFIANKINFLLDATLGMINIEQSAIIKIFSVAAVIFLPPTLIASIYGMNFQFMPELSYKWGYLFAIFMMIISAWLPYKYFKYRRWL